MDDFAAELARLQSLLAKDRFDTVERLRELEERWACALLGLPADPDLPGQVQQWVEAGPDAAMATEAAAHLHEAEEWQWQIGTWSTGSGEGLASMAEVRRLQAARAWLCAAVGDEAGAGALIAEVAGDPNRMGERHAASLQALRKRLDR